MFQLVSIAHAAIDSATLGSTLDPIIAHVVRPIIELLFVVAVVVFAFGIFQLVTGESDSEARTAGKNAIFGGIIGMFIMLSAWGFIYLIANTVKSL